MKIDDKFFPGNHLGSKLKSKQTRRFDGKTLRLKTGLDLLIVVKVRALRARKALGVKRIAAFRKLTAFGR